jgi:hypothetical protein
MTGDCLTCRRWERACTSPVESAHAWLSSWARPTLEGLARVHADAPACPGYVSTQRRTPYGDVPPAQRLGLKPKKEKER